MFVQNNPAPDPATTRARIIAENQAAIDLAEDAMLSESAARVGSDDALADVLDHAQATMTSQERAAYDARLADPTTHRSAVDALTLRYRQAQEGAYRAAVTAAGGFTSPQEFAQAVEARRRGELSHSDYFRRLAATPESVLSAATSGGANQF